MSAVPIDISYRNPRLPPAQFHRDSFAHSQGIGGISWGGHSVGSWLREEVLLNNLNMPANAISASPDSSAMPSYFPSLEQDFCKDYSCCGRVLPTLHDLLRHYEDSHITPSPPIEPPVMRRMPNSEMVSTNEVFLAPHLTGGAGVGVGGVGGVGAGAGSGHGGHSGAGSGMHGASAHSHSQALHPDGTPIDKLHGSGMGHPAAHQVAHGGTPAHQGSQINHQGLSQPPAGTQPHPQGGVKSEMTIDDPARQLYVMERNDNRPYKCPVIGCEKTYKNQNGLKYHRLHGHQNQTLHLNEDGSYSIIDPVSNAPYPDGMGMEKDKPYRCEICGKRYKNLNGLKYHRAHSTH